MAYFKVRLAWWKTNSPLQNPGCHTVNLSVQSDTMVIFFLLLNLLILCYFILFVCLFCFLGTGFRYIALGWHGICYVA